MTFKKCEKGHYYDADRYSSCPHCGGNYEILTESEEEHKVFPGLKVEEEAEIEADVISTHVCEATVYQNGALIRRTGSTVLEQGKNELFISGLFENVDEDSIRLYFSCEGVRGSTRMLSYTPNSGANPTDYADKKLLELNKEREKTEREIKDILDQIRLLKKYQKNLVSKTIEMETLMSVFETVPEKLDTLYSELDKLSSNVTQILKQQEEWTEEKKQIERRHQKPCLAADVWSEKAGTFDFIIEYFEKKVNWLPSYELIADFQNRKLCFHLRGKVRQWTEENWEQVKIRLNTGKPHSFKSLPQLRPHFVGIRKPFYMASRYSPEYDYDMMDGETTERPILSGGYTAKAPLEDNADMEDRTVKRMRGEEARVEDQEITTEYMLPGVWNINKGGNGNIVEIQSFDAIPDYYYYVYPEKESAAFLVAKLPNKPEQLVLAGRAAVYFDNAFIGYTDIDPEQIGHETELSFGLDQQIRVSRKLLSCYTSTVTLKSQTKVSYEYEIRIKNNKKGEVKLKVVDQIPVSQDKSVRVDAAKLSGGNYSTDDGSVRWDVYLAPGEEKVLILGYDVLCPKGEKTSFLF